MTEPRRGGRGRLLAGLSVALGLATVLLVAPSLRGHDQKASGTPGTDDDGPSAASRKDGFEHRDVRTTSVGLVMVIGVATIAACIVGLFALLGVAHRQDAAAPPLTPQQTAAIVPPGPPLQANPLGDISALRQHEAAELTTYRWLSPDRAAARIPVARAMALLVGQTLDAPPSVRAVP